MRAIRAALIVLAFAAIGAVLALAITSRVDSGSGAYLVRAVFDNSSFVIPGEDVKVAGVKVGTIQSVGLTDDNKAAIATNKSGIAENKAAIAKQADAHEQLKQDVESMKSREFILPAHTVFSARTTSEIDTSKYKNGSIFDAVLEHDVVVDGTTLAEQGGV